MGFMKFGLLGLASRALFILALIAAALWIMFKLTLALWPWLLAIAVAWGIYKLASSPRA